MNLAVVTLTQSDRVAWLDECRISVAAALPSSATHVVHHCAPDVFQETRWLSTHGRAEQYVAWVDDDDLVTPAALRACVEALEETGAGIAFTYEGRIDEAGRALPARYPRRTLRDVAMHPRSLHHLAVIRRACLDPVVYEEARRIGIGIDWLMRAWCALQRGAVQVPFVGYLWRQHEDQESKTLHWQQAYEIAMPELRRVTKSWMRRDETIPQFLPG